MRAPHPRPSDADIRASCRSTTSSRARCRSTRRRDRSRPTTSGAPCAGSSPGVDLGDLARNLGDRVRDLRVHPAPPPTEPRPILQRPPSRPTATQVGTKTFAARDGVARAAAGAPRAGGRSPRRRRAGSSRCAPPRPRARSTPVARAARDRTRAASAPVAAKGDRDRRAPLGACGLAVVAFLLGRAATTQSPSSPTAPPASPRVAPTATADASERDAPPASAPAGARRHVQRRLRSGALPRARSSSLLGDGTARQRRRRPARRLPRARHPRAGAPHGRLHVPADRRIQGRVA